MIEHDMACQVCTYALNAIDHNGTLTYEHPVVLSNDHDVAPVPAHQLEDVYRHCHICSATEPLWLYRTPPIEALSIGATPPVTETYSTHWKVCPACAQLIEQHDSDTLTRHSIAAVGWHRVGPAAQILASLHRAIVLTRESGRTLVTTGAWNPAQLKAATLPKVRDRLTGLLRGPVQLPTPLHHDEPRRTVADGLDQARLYWIDPQFTALITQVVTDLPDTTITDRIVPAGSGLITWSTPVDQRHHIAAASWTPHPDGWRILCYRSLGPDLPPNLLEPTRHEIGWLIPIHAVNIPRETILNAESPLAALVASWLIIAQQLTHDEPTLVDPPIRKAYARARRPAPEVRLIRIKPRHSQPQTTETPSGRSPTGRAKPDHRYWVSGHERNQAYGPGRSLRHKIQIDPFLKGPDDAPIKASTTVRVLGTSRTRQGDHNDPTTSER